MAANKDWDRLAEFTRERRVELELTQEDVRFAAWPVHCHDAPHRRCPSAGLPAAATLRDLEKALQWSAAPSRASSAEVIPSSLPLPIPARCPRRRRWRRRWESHVEEILMRVEFARRRHPGQQLTGAMVFPASPRDALHWDSLRRDGEPEEAVIQGLAALAAWRQEESRSPGERHRDGHPPRLKQPA